MEEPILKVSLKDYKKSIDDLRASLLGLEATSEEYKATAEEIREKQAKLNEVMKVGKNDVDAAANSYNALQQQMTALKKEWKNMEIGTEEWKAMAVQINSLNDQLKEADALTGNYQRNVGDYANAFGAAFDKAAGELSKMPGMLGTVFKITKDLTPAIKQASTTATAGLSGVKKAIASTGIGALIVAVGLLITHWSDLVKLFRKGKSDADNLAASIEAMNKDFDDQNKYLDNEITLLKAEGVETDELIGKKIELVRTQAALVRAKILETMATINQINAHSLLRKMFTGENRELKQLLKSVGDLNDMERQLNEELAKLETERTANTIKGRKDREEEYENEAKAADDLVKQLEENNKTEQQKLKEKYEKDLALLKKHHKDTKLLTEKFNKDMAELVKKGEEDAAAARRKAQEEEQARLSKGWKGGTPLEGSGAAVKKELLDAYAAYTAITRQMEDISSTGVRKVWLKEGQTIEEYNEELAAAIERLVNAEKAVVAQRAETMDVAFRWRAVLNKGAHSDTEAIAALELQIEDYLLVLNTYTDYVRDEEGNNPFEGLIKGSNEWRQAILDNLMLFPEDARSHFLELWEELLAAKQKLEEDDIAKEKEYLAERMENWQIMGGSVSDVIGSITDLMDSSIEHQKKVLMDEQGLSEEQANSILKPQFERMKAFQIAQATINTLSGVIGAFMGITRDTGGWGIAAAAAQATAIAMAGAAQIAKIRNTEIGKTDDVVEGVSVSPRLGDYTPNTTANLTSASDTDRLAAAMAKQNIYVKVSDIDLAQKKVRVRADESRF